MYTAYSIQNFIRRYYGFCLSIYQSALFLRFLDGYFRGLRKHGYFLIDTNLHDLDLEARKDFIEEAFDLWISSKGMVETGKTYKKDK